MKISLVESVIHCEQNVFLCVKFKNDHGTHDKTTTTQMSIQKMKLLLGVLGTLAFSVRAQSQSLCFI